MYKEIEVNTNFSSEILTDHLKIDLSILWKKLDLIDLRNKTIIDSRKGNFEGNNARISKRGSYG